jgi:hypothetical protein
MFLREEGGTISGFRVDEGKVIFVVVEDAK